MLQVMMEELRLQLPPRFEMSKKPLEAVQQ